MSNVGRGPSGYVYTGKPGLPPSFLEIGTNSGLTDHGVVLAQGADAFVATSPGTAGQVLMSNGAGADPSFQTGGSTIPNTLTGNTGGPISPSGGNINTVGTGSITIAGSGDTLTTQLTGLTDHAVLVGAGTATITKVGPVASTGAMLQSNGLASDPGFSTSTWPATTTINQILYSSAANTVAGLATANRGVLTTGATGVPVITALATDGQVIIGSTAGAPAAASLTAGANITITPGSNSITIAASGGGLTWSEETASPVTAAVNEGYVANLGSLLTINLPGTFAIGDIIRVAGKGAGLWVIDAPAGDTIIFGNQVTSSGGTITATNANDCIEIVGTTADSVWTVLSSVGNFTIA